MWQLLFSIVALCHCATIDLYKTTQTGQGTYAGSAFGACGISTIPSWAASLKKVAMNAIDFADEDQSLGCGMCVQVNGTGIVSGAKPTAGTFTAYVVDKCQKCPKGHIDFLGVTGDGWNINWKAIPCPVGAEKIDYVFQGSDPNYIKIQPRSTAKPVRNLEVQSSTGEWYEATRTADNFFECQDCPIFPIALPLSLRLTSVDSEVLLDTVSSIGTDLIATPGSGVQFNGSIEATLTPTPTPTPKRATLVTGWSINSVALATGGSTIPSSGTFTVNVGYTVASTAKIVIDILNSATYAWYGGGSLYVATGTRTTSITVNAQNVPNVGLTLKVWIVSSQDANLASAWNYAKAERMTSVVVSGGSTQPPPTTTPPPTSIPPPPPVVITNPTGPGKFTTTVGTSYARFTQFLTKLTTLEAGNARAVHSSGGAAGGVVSEGQGYGLFLAGATAASLGKSDTNFKWTIDRGYELFTGWKKMCKLSTSNHCQSQRYCEGSACLPHWKFNDRLTAAEGTGSAPDGDEDAILGMILLVLATKDNRPTWWSEVAKWTYWSSKQFYESSTVSSSNGSWRIVKLGSCWGGWDCNNPSYHAPAAYRAMRDYMKNYGSALGFGTEGASYVSKWNTLIKTTYAILLADQCPQTGLTTNWYVPNQSSPTTRGTTGCSGSGTPADQYGSEASRGVWRVALDWMWYGDEDTKNPAAYLTPVVSHVISKYQGGRFSDLSTGCLVKSIHSSWSSLAFMYGPTFASLVFPTSNSNHGTTLAAAANTLKAATINDYYAGSWVAISTMTLNGDLAKVKSLLRSTSAVPALSLDDAEGAEHTHDDNEHGGLSGGVIAGIAVGAAVGVLLVAVVGYYALSQRASVAHERV